MDAVSLVSAVVAVCSAALAGFFGYWQQRRLRSWEQRDYMDRYGASLAWAAFDLQTRLFNILRGHVLDNDPDRGDGYMTSFLTRGTEREAAFARRSTVFVLAEYLGWVEILRRDVQFLDLGGNRLNTRVMLQLSRIGAILARIDAVSNELRLFRGQQRAIGELMVHPEGEPGRRRCLGFAEFCAKLDDDAAFALWFSDLLADVDRLAGDTAPAVPRLGELQTELVALIDLLDPQEARFPQFRLAFGRGGLPPG
ncbi:hypothetical protein AB0O07_10685 [Streptomyces sp. NPDC093085]|uniref:hypothetical protein n=1 Tax=Streptomyces sp. NPDC093085 TaxID=3155068 RepID=UPI0034320B4A